MGESNEACTGGNYSVEWSFATDGVIDRGVTERVEIEGRRIVDRDYSYTCRDGVCIDIEESDNYSSVASRGGGWIASAVIWATGVANNAEDACAATASPAATPHGRTAMQTVTSHSAAQERIAAAYETARATRLLEILPFGLARPGPTLLGYTLNDGFTVKITYSDGGTEDFKFAINNPTHAPLQPVAGTLQQGDGVSKCPP